MKSDRQAKLAASSTVRNDRIIEELNVNFRCSMNCIFSLNIIEVHAKFYSDSDKISLPMAMLFSFKYS